MKINHNQPTTQLNVSTTNNTKQVDLTTKNQPPTTQQNAVAKQDTVQISKEALALQSANQSVNTNTNTGVTKSTTESKPSVSNSPAKVNGQNALTQKAISAYQKTMNMNGNSSRKVTSTSIETPTAKQTGTATKDLNKTFNNVFGSKQGAKKFFDVKSTNQLMTTLHQQTTESLLTRFVNKGSATMMTKAIQQGLFSQLGLSNPQLQAPTATSPTNLTESSSLTDLTSLTDAFTSGSSMSTTTSQNTISPTSPTTTIQDSSTGSISSLQSQLSDITGALQDVNSQLNDVSSTVDQTTSWIMTHLPDDKQNQTNTRHGSDSHSSDCVSRVIDQTITQNILNAVNNKMLLDNFPTIQSSYEDIKHFVTQIR